MTKQELLAVLEVQQQNKDATKAHEEADKALLEFIDDEEVSEAFEKVKRWYD